MLSSNINLKEAFSLLSSNAHLRVCTHYLADVDAVCSSFLLRTIFPGYEVVFFDKPTYTARRVLKSYGFEYVVQEAEEVNCAEAVLVDNNDASLIPALQGEFLLCIDHHTSSSPVKSKYYAIERNSPSTTHIIYSMMKENGIVPTKIQSELILLGILSDTHMLASVPNRRLFKDLHELFSVEGVSDYDSLASLIRSVLTDSEKIVFARSFNNYAMYKDKSKSLLFIMSDCQSFQSLVATKLIECIGADFSMAYAPYPKSDELRVSLRSSPRVGIHLGKLAMEISVKLGGSGGGHEHAAGMNLPLRTEKNLEQVALSLLSNYYSLEQINI